MWLDRFTGPSVQSQHFAGELIWPWSRHQKLTRRAAAPRASEAKPGPLTGLTENTSVSERRAQDRSRVRREKVAERIGLATEQLAAGFTEAAAAAEQLRRALDQIATAAEEAAGASSE